MTVGLTANGAPVGTATTGANGYYYIFAPPGTLTAGESLVAATIAGAPVESSTYTATGAVAQTSVNIYGPAPGAVLPTQGAVNLASPTPSGSLASNTLVGGVETPGTTQYVSTGAAATVTLTASRTLIDWTTFEVGAGDTLDFNFTGSASDIVLNRVVGGAITVDTGGQVNGFYNGAPGGNLWFLSPAGVFIHGSVTAGGVLASNNTGVPDLNLLSDSLPTLKGELAMGASLIDLTGAVTVSGASIDGSGNVVLGGDVDTGPAGAVNLVSTGTITQAGGVITASTLDSASGGSATLTDQNQVATLGPSTSGAGTLAFTDAIATGLTIGGTIGAGAGDIDITTTGPGATLTLAASLTTDSAHAVNLVSAGPVDQTTSIITTGTFSGSSVGGATLYGDNAFNTLGGFTNTGAGDVNISDFQPTGLTVAGAIDVGAGNNFGLGNDLGGALTLASNITAAGGTVSLGSVGPIAQISGVITAGALAGGSTGGASFTGANQFGVLAGFTNTSGGNLTIVDALASGLTVTGLVNAGAGNTLGLTTTGGPLTLAASLLSPSGVVDLSSASTIGQTGGVIVAATLNSASNGAALLTGQNQVVSLGSFSNGGAGTLAFTDAIASGLTIISNIASGAGDIDLTTTAPGAALTLAADLSTDPTHAVALVSAGPIAQISGDITTSTVSGSSVGGASLTDANLFSNLGPFANLDASNVTIVDALPSGLTVIGAVDAGVGNNLNLTTTAGPLTLAADVSAAGGVITLTSAGSIGQTAGIMTTGTLTGSSLGGARLTDANQIATLAGFTNADSGAISLTDAQSLAITGVVDNTRVLVAPGIGRDIAIDITAGNLTAGAAPITAAGDVALQAVDGSLTLSTVSSGGDVVLVAGQGAVNLGGPVSAAGTAAAGAGQTLFNAISGPLDGLFTLHNQSLFIEAKTFSNAAGSPLTAGAAIGISLSDPGGLYLANASPGVGSWVRPASLLAPGVTLFERVGNLNVAAATIGGPINSLNLYAANFVQVTGVLAPAVDNTVNLTIGSPTAAAWAPSQIDVLNDGGGSANQGSIGYQTINASGTYSATPLTFHSANLNATSDILMGTSAFVAANAAIVDAALLLTNPNTPVPATPANTSRTVLLAADNASLAAGRQIVQQNTAGPGVQNGVGTYVTGVLTLSAYGGSPPVALDLFGAFVVSGSGAVVTGQAAAASSQIVLSGSLLSSPYRDLYRFNGCAIGLGGCLTGSSTTLSVVSNVANQGVLFGAADMGVPGDPQNADDSSEESDDSGAGSGTGGQSANPVNIVNAGEAAFQDNPFSTFGQRALHPQINMSYVVRNGFLRFEETDLEDLTITGAPNEEVWRKPDVRP